MAGAYIAGPMRGYPNLNFPAFDAATRLGRALGWDVISPADIDRQSGINEAEDMVFTPEMIRAFVLRDVGALLELRAENGDAIALLPGWMRSTGAKAELAVATWLGLKILDATTFLPLKAEVMGVEYRPPVPAQFQTCATGRCGGIDVERETYAIRTIADRYASGELK